MAVWLLINLKKLFPYYYLKALSRTFKMSPKTGPTDFPFIIQFLLQESLRNQNLSFSPKK